MLIQTRIGFFKYIPPDGWTIEKMLLLSDAALIKVMNNPKG